MSEIIGIRVGVSLSFFLFILMHSVDTSSGESFSRESYSALRTDYKNGLYCEVVKKGMPLLRKIALQHAKLPAVSDTRTKILILSESSRKIIEGMARIQRLLREGGRVKRPIQKEIRALQAFISDLKKLETRGASTEAGAVPRLRRSETSADEALSQQEQAILDMLVDSTRRVKDGVVFHEYLKCAQGRKRDHGITGRLDNGITGEGDSDKTRKRESGNKENGMDMLRHYVYAYLALTRSPDALVKTIDWMPDSLKGPEQLLDFVDLCSRLKEQDSAIALCAEIADRFYGQDAAVRALQKQAEICVDLKRLDEALAANHQIIDMYALGGEAGNLSVSGETSYKFSHRLLKARYEIIKIYGYEMKMYSAAIRECKKLIEAFPNTQAAVYAEYLIGQFLYQNEEYAKAAEAFQKYIEKVKGRGASNLVEAKLLLALSYMGQRKEDDAVAVLREIVRDHPNNKFAAKAQFLLGYCFLTRQRYAEAREEYKKLLEEYPGSNYEGQAADYVEKLKGVQLPNPNDQ